MDKEFEKLKIFSNDVIVYGQDVIFALAILVLGLLILKVIARYLRPILRSVRLNETVASIVANTILVLLLVVVLAAASHRAGMPSIVITRVLAALALAAVGLIVVFRPMLPSLPFKVGNTVRAGGLLGKVEATTILNTRLKTFDGKTLFIPNRIILNDIIENFHFNPTRQIRIVVGIGYQDDLLKAKQVVSEILARDPRILDQPPARVFVMNLADSCVEIAAWSWVKNSDYWRTRCDLLEIIKLRFDHEGITIAFPQRDVHIYKEIPDEPERGNENHR